MTIIRKVTEKGMPQLLKDEQEMCWKRWLGRRGKERAQHRKRAKGKERKRTIDKDLEKERETRKRYR